VPPATAAPPATQGVGRVAHHLQPHRGPGYAAEQHLNRETALPRVHIHQDHCRLLLALEAAHGVAEDLARTYHLVAELIVLTGEARQGVVADPLHSTQRGVLPAPAGEHRDLLGQEVLGDQRLAVARGGQHPQA
jgi:hypothetical protein